MKIKCVLENVVRNLDGTTTYYLRDSEKYADRHIDEIKELNEKSKKGLKVEIGEWREQRSLDANAYFHYLVDKIAKATNKGADEVKKQMNFDYGTIMTDDKGKKVGIKLPKSVDVDLIYGYAKWFDTRVENGIEFNCYIIYKPTHTLDTKEMSVLIDGVVQEADNLGIETKSKNEIEEMLKGWRIK